ncbi:hypothetical protein QBC36DRAFT_23905 [Triangularia setosa]|uniref:Uncharacterized protein n=1 Tax=Triangularia setosa TaxID=2587417 RepID=A0AAN7A632_9PEZI|nr:hypothetical protein QBC36DRAFT_23905 [Podospora setosa]
MPAGEIVTIINNSGKVISTGKQLVNIFKDAQAAYRERKEAVKAEKAQRAGIRRAQTFDVNLTRGGPYSEDFNYTHGPGKGGFIIEEIDDEKEKEYERRMIGAAPGRRRSHEDDDDGRSHASSRLTTRSKRTSYRQQALPAAPSPGSAAAPRTVVSLTESALKAHSEISAAAPSKAPSKAPSAAPGPGALVHRSRTEPVLSTTVKKKKSIDMDLAYGSIPPDLAQRHDLAPKDVVVSRSINTVGITMSDQDTEVDPQVEIDPQEAQALGLMDKIEEFLQEADCVHASATNMIESLQQKPEAAAAVALSLAELSALVGKMSPAFLAFLKGGSPAVFALLASPQFLIGAGVAAGITVVMFGGWKIVKKMTSGNAAPVKEQPIAMRALPMASGAPQHQQRLQELEGQAEQQNEVSNEEPLAADEVQELSSIEMWRRGIEPSFAEGTAVAGDEAAEIEMMSREAEKYARENFRSNKYDIEVDPSDSVSQIGWSPSKSMRSYKTYKSRSSRHPSSSRRNREDRMTEVSVDDVPERRSSRKDDGESVAGSERSYRGSKKARDSRDRDGAESAASDRSHRSSASRRDHREKERDREHTRLEGINEKDEGSSVAGNERSHRSKREREREHKGEKKNDKDDDGSVASFRSARSTRNHREKERDRDDNSSSVSRSSKYISSKVTPIKEEGADDKDDKIKKPNMLKQLFKRMKDKEDRDSSVVSVMI